MNVAAASPNRNPSEKVESRFPENLPPGWRAKLASEKEAPYFKKLSDFLRSEISKGAVVFPARDRMLRALQLVDLDKVRVVLLGQDPYHGANQAMGLSFAVPNSLKPKPPSLLNIFKELESDIGLQWNKSDSELTGWAKQGVLLLNSLLSVREGQPLSHADKGWEIFTNRMIQILNEREEPLIFFLWGSNAQRKAEMISDKHFVLKAPHPSPLSAHRGFLGCKHFSKANEIIQSLGHVPIDWAKIND